MSKHIHLPIPVMGALRKLGQDINGARRRRRITMALMAERAGIAVNTLAKIEKGDPAASMAAYASVLFVLGLTDSLRDIADASRDLTGRMLEEERLPKRIRYPKRTPHGGQNGQ
ncbi:transcriptional regulator [Spirochaetia bacterium]|nr:transcriptional regulator [Spirochaetia bacterium]GHV91128.1 transcriptional regulator [Spirochaetia bacterium]